LIIGNLSFYDPSGIECNHPTNSLTVQIQGSQIALASTAIDTYCDGKTEYLSGVAYVKYEYCKTSNLNDNCENCTNWQPVPAGDNGKDWQGDNDSYGLEFNSSLVESGFGYTCFRSRSIDWAGLESDWSYSNPITIDNRTLNSISIDGSAQINEQSNAQYNCTAHYSDGSTEDVTASASWSDNHAFTSINSTGLLTAENIASDINITITAEYEGEIDTFDVTVTALPCVFELSSNSEIFDHSGGIQTVDVTTEFGCAWTAVSNDNWVTVDSGSSGNDDGTVNYTVSENTSLSSRSGSITIATHIHTVEQSGRPPVEGSIDVSPSDGLSSSGNAGGPFTPASKTYTIENAGELEISWQISSSQNWINISESFGTLAGGASTSIIVSITSSANSLSDGNYTDVIQFTNQTNGNGNTSRNVALSVDVIDQGTVNIDATPDSINAPWVLTNTEGYVLNGNGDLTTYVVSGEYTLTWGEIASWIKPNPQTKTVSSNQITSFAGTYTQSTTHQYFIHTGWNLIALKRLPQNGLTASTLCQEINSQGGSITKLQEWDGSGWKTYTFGAPFGDFAIEAGKGYFLFSQVESVWVNSDEMPDCIIPYNFDYGWNLFGFPNLETETASSLIQSFNSSGASITKIQSWDGSGWETYSVGAPFGNYTINSDSGYFLFSDYPFTIEIDCSE
jgi:hypothetical protein